MKREDIKLGKRVLVSYLDNDAQNLFFIKNVCEAYDLKINLPNKRLQNITGTIVDYHTTFYDPDHGDIVIVEHDSSLSETELGIKVNKIRAAYLAEELQEMMQLPFDPPSFDETLIKWVETKENN